MCPAASGGRGRTEGAFMKNRNLLILVVLAIVVLVVFGFIAGWFDSTPVEPAATIEPTSETETLAVEPEADTTGTTTGTTTTDTTTTDEGAATTGTTTTDEGTTTTTE